MYFVIRTFKSNVVGVNVGTDWNNRESGLHPDAALGGDADALGGDVGALDDDVDVLGVHESDVLGIRLDACDVGGDAHGAQRE